MGILLLFVANLCLLVHGIVPHHHHGGVPVAIVAMADHHHGHEHHGHDEHDGSHDHYHHSHIHHDTHRHGHESEDCLISDNLFVVVRGQESGYNLSDDGAEDALALLYCEAGTMCLLPQCPATQLRFYTYRSGIPPGVYIDSNGLRAPPYC